MEVADTNDEEFSGVVEVRVVNRGSKSEHRSAYLNSEAGTFRLKRPAGPPFHDPVLLRLEGSTIRCRGRLRNGVLMLSRWRKCVRHS